MVLRKLKFLILLLLSTQLLMACSSGSQANMSIIGKMDSVIAKGNLKKSNIKKESKMEQITLGAGCFWCVEAVFQNLEGVISVESGYSNGAVENPTYKEVCTGTTGHAEVCQITFDPAKISLEDILEVFWKTHDPTTLNRQGADVGTQYRSGVYFTTPEQEATAKAWKEKLNAEKVFPNPIVTEIVPLTQFYKAENYHQDYYNQNGYEPYCQIVIKPKIDKLEKVFKDRLKKK
jgi:peptide-methionine (S)-S-oxide reductase